jgi:two-component system nitrate/nitrite response regulator NarL
VEIGRILVISPRTARTHIQNILEKLGVHSRLEAAALASRNAVREELAVP